MQLGLEKSLADIVAGVEQAGFTKSHQLTIGEGLDASTWRVYMKPAAKGTVLLAYVSDTSQCILRETFSAPESYNELNAQETTMLEALLKNYASSTAQIAQVKESNQKLTGYAALAGGIIGGVFERTPGLVLGAAAGALVAQAPCIWRLSRAEDRLAAYLTQHNIAVGPAAYDAINAKTA